ncbi:MAG: 50S ribosomal protein L18 [Cyclobacteriaceae bacterium]|nr:50S ribosomal protein L18 [Cyclobacteriaceae bacterium]
MPLNKLERRTRLRLGIRRKIKGTAEKPRLSVFKSNRAIYAQVINDDLGQTIASSSSFDLGVKTNAKVEDSKEVGKKIAEKALASGIATVVFDRGGYRYHGLVKALADGAREGGLKL